MQWTFLVPLCQNRTYLKAFFFADLARGRGIFIKASQGLKFEILPAVLAFLTLPLVPVATLRLFFCLTDPHFWKIKSIFQCGNATYPMPAVGRNRLLRPRVHRTPNLIFHAPPRCWMLQVQLSFLSNTISPTTCQPFFVVDSDTVSIHSKPEESTWDDKRGITTLRKYLFSLYQVLVGARVQNWICPR